MDEKRPHYHKRDSRGKKTKEAVPIPVGYEGLLKVILERRGKLCGKD